MMTILINLCIFEMFAKCIVYVDLTDLTNDLLNLLKIYKCVEKRTFVALKLVFLVFSIDAE